MGSNIETWQLKIHLISCAQHLVGRVFISLRMHCRRSMYVAGLFPCGKGKERSDGSVSCWTCLLHTAFSQLHNIFSKTPQALAWDVDLHASVLIRWIKTVKQGRRNDVFSLGIGMAGGKLIEIDMPWSKSLGAFGHLALNANTRSNHTDWQQIYMPWSKSLGAVSHFALNINTLSNRSDWQQI